MAARYAHGIQEPLRLVEREMNTNLGNDNFIFVGSSCDMFARGIPSTWIIMILEKLKLYNNEYLLQTKHPGRYGLFYRFFDPRRHTLATTIETNRHLPVIMRNSPPPSIRAEYMAKVAKAGFRTMATIEPVMDFDLEELVELIRIVDPEQVNIGADSGNNHLPEPSPEKIAALIGALRGFTDVRLKKNLKRLYKEEA
jgi:DNA repair photolyase